MLADLLVALAATVALGALLCRLNDLSWRVHSASVVGLHVGLAIACVWALLECYQRQVNPGNAAAVAAALCWLRGSYPTWRHGPPPYASKHPDDEAEAVGT